MNLMFQVSLVPTWYPHPWHHHRRPNSPLPLPAQNSPTIISVPCQGADHRFVEGHFSSQADTIVVHSDDDDRDPHYDENGHMDKRRDISVIINALPSTASLVESSPCPHRHSLWSDNIAGQNRPRRIALASVRRLFH